jgi:hypothetical protein
MSDQLIILTVLVLLPMIPAFLLFKLLPSGAVLKGPFQGLNLALSGAFGGYVALTMFVATFYAHTLRPQTYRTWVVRGQLQFPPGERPALRWDLGPPLLQIDANNGFYFQIPVADGAEMPDLVLEAAGYPVKAVKLSGEAVFAKNYRRKIDKALARIQFEEPIVFEKPIAAPAYAPDAAQQPTAITGGG